MRAILEVIAAIGLCVASTFVDEDLRPELYGIVIGLVVAILIEGFLWLYKQRSFLSLYVACLNPFTPKEIRLTIAYLYKIECHGKYLLVKSNRVENLYQPVGGVYKYFNPEASKDLHSIGAVSDTKIENDNDSEHDLRLKLQNKRNIKKFLDWFFSRQERELDPWREFYEELVETSLLPRNIFGYLHYELIGQYFSKLKFDKHFDIMTFKYADIYMPKYITSQQREAIKALQSTKSTEYIWVTREEIIRGYSIDNHRISDIAYTIFHTNKIS